MVAVYRNGTPLDKSAAYTATVNGFLADGGDNFTVLRAGANRVGGPVYLDALIAYIESIPPWRNLIVTFWGKSSLSAGTNHPA